MHRIFVDSISKNRVLVEGEDHNHMARSLRMRPGESVEVVFEDGLFLYEIKEVGKKETYLSKVEKTRELYRAKRELVLYQGLAKGDKFETVIQKTTELGISEIHPLLTQRCVVRPNRKKEDKKLERYQAIAKSAASQSKRDDIPCVGSLKTIEEIEEECILFFYEDEKSNSLKDFISNLICDRIAIVIGPEGGFTPEEAELLVSKGAKSLSLGRRILRTETAGLVATALIQFSIGDLGDV